jgi:hypothetical protein
MASKHRMENWWDDHPLLKKFYVPMVLTATFVVQIADVFRGSRGR